MGTIPHGIYNNNGHGRGRRVDLYLPGRFSFSYFSPRAFPLLVQLAVRRRGCTRARSKVQRRFVHRSSPFPRRILTLAICTEITTPRRAPSLSRFLRFFSFLSCLLLLPPPPPSPPPLSIWLSLNRSLLRPFPFSFFWRFSRKRWYSRRSTDHGTLIYGRLDPMDKPVDVNWPEKFNRLPI